MHEVYLNSMRDTLLVGVPFIVILALAIFRLDTFLVATKGAASRGQSTRRQGCGMDENGEPLLVDPDGRSSEVVQKRR